MFLVLGSCGAWVSQALPRVPKQLYPRSLDLVWPGHLHGMGCLSARAIDTGFPTVVWCLCLGLDFAVTLPLLAGVQGVCVLARVSVSPRHSRLGFVVRAFGVWFSGNPAFPGWGLGCVCLDMGFGCAPPFLAGVCGACVWVWVFRAPCLFWLACWGVCSLARAPSVSRHPLLGLPVAWGFLGDSSCRVRICPKVPDCGTQKK